MFDEQIQQLATDLAIEQSRVIKESFPQHVFFDISKVSLIVRPDDVEVYCFNNVPFLELYPAQII